MEVLEEERGIRLFELMDVEETGNLTLEELCIVRGEEKENLMTRLEMSSKDLTLLTLTLLTLTLLTLTLTLLTLTLTLVSRLEMSSKEELLDVEDWSFYLETKKKDLGVRKFEFFLSFLESEVPPMRRRLSP